MKRGMSAKNVNFSQFYCTICGQKGLDIPRRKGAEREAGHLKKIFCLNCQKETNHCECKPFTKYSYEDFCIEYEYGNFNEIGQRVCPYSELRSLINNGKIEKIKTLDHGRDFWLGQEHLDTES